MRYRALTAWLDCDFLAIMRAAREGGVNATRRGNASNNGFIAPVDTMFCELRRQAFMSKVGFGDNKQPRSILVDAVDDAGAGNAANPRQATCAMVK